MMPLATLPAMPKASTCCAGVKRSAAPMPAVAPNAPNTAVG